MNSLAKGDSTVKSSHLQRMFGFAAAGASLAAVGAQAHAQQIIIQDIFTSGSEYGTGLGAESANKVPGLVPTPTNLPGGPWQHINGAFYGANEFSGNLNGIIGGGDPTPADLAGFDGASDGIALGSYNTGSLHISAGVYYLIRAGSTLPPTGEYILAGFSSALNSGSNYGPSALSTFTGLAVVGPAGSLQEYVNGSPVGDPIAFKGGYNAYAETMLSYTIDTVNGVIRDVRFGNSKANYSFPVPRSFSRAYTANADIGGSAGRAGVAAISSFILSSGGAVNSRLDGK
jgi:hypothetical protein